MKPNCEQRAQAPKSEQTLIDRKKTKFIHKRCVQNPMFCNNLCKLCIANVLIIAKLLFVRFTNKGIKHDIVH